MQKSFFFCFFIYLFFSFGFLFLAEYINKRKHLLVLSRWEETFQKVRLILFFDWWCVPNILQALEKFCNLHWAVSHTWIDMKIHVFKRECFSEDVLLRNNNHFKQFFNFEWISKDVILGKNYFKQFVVEQNFDTWREKLISSSLTFQRRNVVSCDSRSFSQPINFLFYVAIPLFSRDVFQNIGSEKF